ncbi:MAG: tungsten cofactor oxidoreductase radical SAM maturase [Proteobacteria bacterium]|nr:tungsten cofactor oxidoreductase radical SAM maturase [Pseudomonadota bacterium]
MHTFDFETYQVVVKENVSINKIYLELTGACNFECKMCFRHSFSEPLGDMSDALVDKIKRSITQLPNLRKIVFGGIGEPLMHPRLPELISFVKKRGIHVTVSTNGYLLGDFIDCFVDNKVDRIVVSYEYGDIGHPKEDVLWDKIRALAKKRDQIESYWPFICLELVVHKANIGELTTLTPLIEDASIHEVVISNLMPIDEALSELTLYPGKEPKKIAEFRNSLPANILTSTANFELKTERNCNFVDNNAIVIRWDGEVAPCYRFLHSATEVVEGKKKEIVAFSFGNILTTSLKKIWNKRESAWFKYCVANSLYPSCIDCALHDGCQYTENTLSDCWGSDNSCGDCLWERNIIFCP